MDEAQDKDNKTDSAAFDWKNKKGFFLQRKKPFLFIYLI